MGEGPKRKDSRGMLANGSGRVRAAIVMIWCKSVNVMMMVRMMRMMLYSMEAMMARYISLRPHNLQFHILGYLSQVTDLG